MRVALPLLLVASALAGCSTSASPAAPDAASGLADTRDATTEGDVGDASWAEVADGALDASTCGDAQGDASIAPPTFERRTLDTLYRSEGVSVFDVDNDGRPDIVTDPYWYAGPAFVTRHELRAPVSWDPARELAECFGVYPQDLDHDGFLDVIVAPHPGDAMYWYQNPAGKDAHWPRHLVAPAGVAGLENPVVERVFAEGPPVLLMMDSVSSVIGWYTPGPDPTQPFVRHDIGSLSASWTAVFTHGIGVGDVNADGRVDVLFGSGWFEQPVDRGATWPMHAFAFGRYLGDPRACHRMWTYDVNGDRLADVLCSRPHDYGIHWFEQRAPMDGGKETTFVDHVIDSTISQMHALTLADLDGDGVPELVSGKRWWAQGPGVNPGAGDPALLVYYRMTGSGDAVTFERREIDGESGLGVAFSIADLDGDCKPDIVTANKKGLYYFHQK